MTRCLTVAALIAALWPQPTPAEAACGTWYTTGYVVPTGSPTYSGEWPRAWETAAASWSVPLGATVWIRGVGTVRINDRGHLGPRHIDVAVSTIEEAYSITGYRYACISD